MWSRISRRISSRSAGGEEEEVLVVLVDRGVTVVDEEIAAEDEVGGEEEVRGEGEGGVVEVEVGVEVIEH